MFGDNQMKVVNLVSHFSLIHRINIFALNSPLRTLLESALMHKEQSLAHVRLDTIFRL